VARSKVFEAIVPTSNPHRRAVDLAGRPTPAKPLARRWHGPQPVKRIDHQRAWIAELLDEILGVGQRFLEVVRFFLAATRLHDDPT
jgi:hypothetical protein